MPAVPAPAEVLVTGASGFLGSHLSQAFLARGYNVRGTVRSTAKGDYLRNLFEKDYPGKFTYVIVEDIAAPGAFDEAVKGVDAIAHTASPFQYVADDADPDVLIKPAVHGTTGVLESAKKNGTSVKRVIVTSSVAAVATMGSSYEGAHTFTANDWNEKAVQEVKSKGAKAGAALKYGASKVLAERAFWDFISANKNSITFDGVTTNTPYIYGPVIHEVKSFDHLNTSTKVLYGLLKDPLPEDEKELGQWQDDYIHVSDITRAQVDAIAHEKVAGHRLVLAGGPLTRQDFLDAYHSLNPAPKLPFTVPRGKPGLGDDKRDTFVRFSTDSQKLLGLKLRSLKEVVNDTLQSLNERKLI